MMSSVLSLFSFRALDKLDLEILDLWLFIELSILEWFLTWFFKYALIPVHMYFQTPIALWSSSWHPVLVLNFQPAGGRIYLQRVWSVSLRLYVGWTHQLAHNNKHIRFEYFESRVALPTVLNQQIFLNFFSQPWFLFYCRYYRQHMTFARSLHSFIIFNTYSDCVDRDCAQSKLGSSATTVTILSQFKLGLPSTKLLRYIIGKIPSRIRLSINVKY